MRPDIESLDTGIAASGAALIATFYGPREVKEPLEESLTGMLHRRLYRSLAAAPEITDVPKEWCHPKDGTILSCLEPAAASDAAAIRLALNAPGDAVRRWEDMRKELEGLLDDEDLKGIWGYTLVYQAVSNRDLDLASKELLPSVRRLGSEDRLHELAQADVSGGRVWLLDIPIQDEGLAAATVYVALSPPDPPGQEEAFMKALFGGPNAMLFMPELIAHKGYHQTRQHRSGELQNLYKTSVGSLRETTERLLSDLGGRRTDGLDELARKYNLLVPVAAKLKGLHISLLRQSHNYDRWRARIEDNEITEYHRDRLATATLELELKVEELQHALETADKAVSIAQVKVDEAQERRQLRIEALLAAAAVGLALPHLLEPETISAFLEWPIGYEVLHTENGLLTGIGHLIALGVQVAIILPVAVLTYLGAKGSLHKPRGASKRVRS